MRTRQAVVAILLALVFALPALASVPPIINYQGRLTQPSGAPVADGTYSMLFSIYDVPTGGTPLWSETNPSVAVKGGLFATLLGSVVNLPANIFDNPTRYFAVKVGSDPEMTPRQQVASSAFAFRADVSSSVDDGAIGTSKIVNGAVSTDKLATGAVTADKLAAGIAIPAGTIMAFGGTTVPAGWVPCDGSSLARTDYAALFSAVGTAWGTADGSHFNVPDLRGRFVRGKDGGAARDPDRAARTAGNPGGNTGDNVGSIQADAFQGHWHDLYFQAANDATPWSGYGSGNHYFKDGGYNSEGNRCRTLVSDGADGTPRTSNETRPANADVNFIIKI